MTIFKKYLWPAALLTAIFLLFAGCKDDDEASIDVVLRSDFVDCNATTNRILATGSSMSFVATIVEQDGDETWCAFDSFEPGATPPRLSKEGQVGIPMTIYLLRNEVEQERTATIDVVLPMLRSAGLRSPRALIPKRLGTTASGASSPLTGRTNPMFTRPISPI